MKSTLTGKSRRIMSVVLSLIIAVQSPIMAGEIVDNEGITVEEALTTEELAEEELAEEEVINEASIEEELPEEITIEEVPEETAVEVISEEESLDGELFEEAVEDSLVPEEIIEEELPDGAIEDINIQQPESVSEDEENLLETDENKDDPVLAGGISIESVSSIEFGYYPQSKVTDSYLLDLLKEESESFSYNGKSYVKKGNEWYLCEPIKWRILSQSDGKAFVMSEKILDSCALNNKWVDSDARKWLNSTFIDQAFGEEERECIYLSGIKTGDVTTDDYLFYPSENDLKNSTYGFEKDEDRIAFGTEYSKSNDTYLTRDTWATFIERYVVAVYGWSGQIVSTMPAYAGYGARPCMYIELEKAMAISEQYNSTDPSEQIYSTLVITDSKNTPLSGVKAYQDGIGPFISDEEGKIVFDKSLLGSDNRNSKYTNFALVLEKEGYRTKKYKVYDFPEDEPDSAGAAVDPDAEGLDADLSIGVNGDLDADAIDGDLYAVGADSGNRIKLYPMVESYAGDFSYLAENGTEDTHGQCEYNDSFFTGSNAVYNHLLARMSLSLAMSAFNSSINCREITDKEMAQGYYYYYGENVPGNTRKIEQTPACNVADLLYKCGFDDISVNEDFVLTTNYHPGINDGHNMGCCIANKELSDGTTLIAIALRGAGYGCEWIGDFEVYGSVDQHRGFYLASQKVQDYFKEYIKEYSLSGKKIKLWITGYSRAAAVANLIAAKYCADGVDSCICDSSDVFAYTFETPRGTRDLLASASVYDGIWNIVNPIDPVPMVAMKLWGYRRFGHTVHLPSFETRFIATQKYKEQVIRAYNHQTGKAAFDLPQLPFQMFAYELIMDSVAASTFPLLDNSSTAREVQNALQTFFRLKYNVSLQEGISEMINSLFKSEPSLSKKGILKSIVDNTGMVIDAATAAHVPDLTYAWMNVIPENEVKEYELVSTILFNCPVDISVYDQSGRLQLKIIENEVIPEADASVQAFVDEDGQKILSVPSDIQARIEILATGEGEFNYSVQEIHLDDTDSKIINYEPVEITEGDTLTGTVSAEDGNGYVEYHLYEDAGEVPIETVISGAGADEMHMISVEAEGDGAVSEGSYKKIGEFIQVEATPAENAKFEGWFEGDNLLSTETTYRHKVTGETTLTAKFKSRILFSDVTNPDDFFYAPIYWAVDNGITTGYKDNTFRPYNNCNRASVVTFLWRLAGKPDMGITNAFKDMTGNDDFDHAITWAAANGITTGYKGGTFRPWDTCHRAAIVTFLWRYAGRPEPTSMANFADMTGNDDFNKAISWAAENGITTGYDDGTFRPYNQCSRLAVATFLYRYAHL